MGYSLTSICIKIFERCNLKKYDQLLFYKLFSLSFILIFFYRLSEHGTDRSAQILSFILIMEIFYFFQKRTKFKYFFYKNICYWKFGNFTKSILFSLFNIINSYFSFYLFRKKNCILN